MPLRRLGDGSFLNEETGELSGYDPQREAAGMRISAAMGHLPQQRAQAQRPPNVQQPVLNKGSQHTPGVDASNAAGTVVKKIIRPDPMLAVNPRELGMGVIPPMSEGAKRIVLTGAIVVAALGAVWINNKFQGKPKHAKK
jgi:hypothetical protein